jgi:hypothetical protein
MICWSCAHWKVQEVQHDIKPHFDKEVKKQPLTRLHIDASYKEAKHLAQYHGNPMFKALITVTNQLGAIRLQFHTVTATF